MADVEMKPADATQDNAEDKKDAKEPPPPPTPTAEIKSNIALIEKGVWSLEPRFTHRVLRSFTALRKKLDDAVLREAIQEVYPAGMSMYKRSRPRMSNMSVDSTVKASLLSWLPEAPTKESMDVDDVPTTKPPTSDPVPEIQIYLQLLLIHHLLANSETYPKAVTLVKETVSKMQALNRRSMDPIAAKVWYAVERTYELAGDLAEARPYVQPRGLVANRADSLSDYSSLLRGLLLSAMMTRRRHHSSTDCFATTSTTVCTTKRTS
jgi:26S proteasome regulatory subunit N3